MRTSRKRVSLTLTAALFILAALPASDASSNPVVQTFMDLRVALPGEGEGTIPGDGSIWHELWFEYCRDWSQMSYVDGDEDGDISANDLMTLRLEMSDLMVRVLGTGSAYFMVSVTGPGGFPVLVVVDPSGALCMSSQVGHDPTDPVGETWYPLHPDACANPIVVQEWADTNQNSILDEGDEITWTPDGADPIVFVFDRAAMAVMVVTPAIPVEKATWGRVKGDFPGSIDE